MRIYLSCAINEMNIKDAKLYVCVHTYVYKYAMFLLYIK